MNETLAPNFKAGYVALVGWPNVGKSSLLNAFIGRKLSIITQVPQTTRDSILGIRNEKESQILFLDTPGWIKPKDRLQAKMKGRVLRALQEDADIVLWVLVPHALREEEKLFAQKLTELNKPLVVLLNKVDTLADKTKSEDSLRSLKEDLPGDIPIYPVSAKTGMGLEKILSVVKAYLPTHPPFYPQDQFTDRLERFYAAELIRESLMTLYSQEIPHATAVCVDEYREKEGHKDFIHATLYVERESQMEILIGKKGQAIKKLGEKSRHEIEYQLERPVYLEIKVKVLKNWRQNSEAVTDLFSKGKY